MSFFDKNEYSISDIQSLIDNEIEESIHLDFKASGSLSKEERKKREITKDVAAFANSDGGIIIYGINEENHKATSFSFVDGTIYTKEWLEQVINSGIQKRIDGVDIIPIRKGGDISQTVYVVKIPQSSNAPHISGDKHYYKRFNFQSVMMEEYEIRDLFQRKNSSKLTINAWGLREDLTDINSEDITYKFVAQVYNNSRAIESVYKLNIYFVGDISKMKFAWKEYESKITYTALENNRLKISAIGVIPIFHEETVDVGKFEIIIPREFKAAFIQNTKIELKLFYSNGMDEQESELKTIQV